MWQKVMEAIKAGKCWFPGTLSVYGSNVSILAAHKSAQVSQFKRKGVSKHCIFYISHQNSLIND